MRNLFTGINLKVIIFTFIVVSITAASSAFLPYKQQKKELAEKLSSELLGIVKTAAITMNYQDHENIFYNPEYGLEGQAEFNKIKMLLSNISDINGLKRQQGLSPIYTLRPSIVDNTKLEFVVMTDRDTNGRFYTGALIDKQPFHKEVLNGQSQTTGIYEDTEGLWITAAAPIKDNTGQVIAIIQADRSIDFYYLKLSELKYNFILGALLGLFLGFVIALIFSKRVIEPIKTLLFATRKFTDGDHSFQISQKRSDEFGELFLSFNLMSEKLSNTLKKLNNTNKELETYALEMQSMALFAKLNPGPVLRVNCQGKIQKINLPARLLFNLNDDNFPTAEISTYINNLPAPVLTEIIKYNKHENYIVHVDEKWIHFVVRGVEEFEFANIYGTDITDLIAAKEKAKQAQKEAEQANQAKTRFLETMSHELLTPMNTIKGYVQLTERRNTDTSLTSYIDKISLSSFHLLELINNILDFVKVESNNIEIINNPFDIREITNKILEIFTAQFQTKNIDLFIYIDPKINTTLVGDKIRIEQIMINLVSNALKFTEKGSVVLSVEAMNKEICFSVEDSGIGIDKQYLNHAFAPFTQADGTSTRKYDGAGLGLSLSQRLAQKMHTTIKIETQENNGTCVSFSLPNALKNTSETESTKDAKHTPLNQKTTIHTNFKPTYNYASKIVASLDIKNENIIKIIDCKNENDLNLAINNNNGTHAIILAPINASINKTDVNHIQLKKPTTTKAITNALKELSQTAVSNTNKHCEQTKNWDIECWGETIDNTKNLHITCSKNDNNQNLTIESSFNSPNKTMNKNSEHINFDLAKGLMSRHDYKKALSEFIHCANSTLIEQPEEALTPTFKNNILLLASPELSELADKIFADDNTLNIKNEIQKYESEFQFLTDKMLISCISELEKMTDDEQDATQLIDGFDTASAIKRMGGKQDRYIKMLNLFYKNYNNNMNETRNYLMDKKTTDAQRIAHSLKGAAATIGALELQETAKMAENELANTQKLSDSSLILLEQHLEATLIKIDSFLHSNDTLNAHSP